MSECNSTENNSIKAIECNSIDKTNLTRRTKYRLSEIIGIEIIFTKRLIKENHAVKN